MTQTADQQQAVTAGAETRARSSRAGSFASRFSGVIVWIGLIVVFAIWVPQTFLTMQTVTSIAADQSVTLILAMGLLLPLVAGQFDLSAAQNLGLSAVVSAVLVSRLGMPLWLAILLTLVVGALIGLLNGLLVLLGVSSFIATLGTSSILLALTALFSGNNYIGPVPPEFQALSNGKFLGLSNVVFVALILAVVAWYVLQRTPLGRRLYAVGANADAARLTGVRTNAYTLGSFIACGVIASLAGVMAAAKIGLVSPSVGPAYLLPAFAACFLGSTQIWVGRFNVWGTAIAILLLATGIKGLQLAGAALWVTDLFYGLALVTAVSIAVVAPKLRSAREARKGREMQNG